MRTEAIRRLLKWYLNSAAAGDLVLDPRPRRTIADEDVPAMRFDGYQQALRWFEIEHETLLAAASQAAEIGEHHLASRFAVRLRTYLDWRYHWDDLIMVSRIGLASAKARGDRTDEANALNAIATGLFRRDEFQPAEHALREALAIFRDIGDLRGELAATGNLGSCYVWSRQFDRAAEPTERALAIADELGNRAYIARPLEPR